MKIQHKHFLRESVRGFSAPRQGEEGLVTVIFIALLAVMLILVMAEGSALFQLHREIKFVEQQQVKRLSNLQTNSVSGVKLDSK